MAQNPTKYGWMIKQGGGMRFFRDAYRLLTQLTGFKSWKRRFFILVNDKLYYFEKENARDPKGFIPLDRQTAVNNTFVDGKQNCFAVKVRLRVCVCACHCARLIACADGQTHFPDFGRVGCRVRRLDSGIERDGARPHDDGIGAHEADCQKEERFALGAARVAHEKRDCGAEKRSPRRH